MRYGKKTFHAPPDPLRLIGLFLVISLGLSTACAQTGPELTGTWSGAITEGNVPVGIDLTITEMKVNKEGGVLHYGEPRACRLAIVFTAIQESYYWFSLKNSTGGFCDKLESGRLKLKLKDTHQVTFETISSSGGAVDSGELTKE